MLVPKIKSLAAVVEAAAQEDVEINCRFLRLHCGKENLENVKDLEIQVDAEIQRISVLGEFLKNLIFMKLDNSRILSLRELGGKLQKLKVLKIARSEVVDLSGLSGLPALEELYAPFNGIQELQPICSCEKLLVLDLEGNRVANGNELQYLTMTPQLIEVSLAGNPIAKELTRAQLISNLPGLKILDDIPVGETAKDTETVFEETELLDNLRGRKDITPSTARAQSAASTARGRSSLSSASGSDLTTSAQPFQGNPLEAIRFRRKLNIQ